jgi:hypothetical protein
MEKALEYCARVDAISGAIGAHRPFVEVVEAENWTFQLLQATKAELKVEWRKTADGAQQVRPLLPAASSGTQRSTSRGCGRCALTWTASLHGR